MLVLQIRELLLVRHILPNYRTQMKMRITIET